MSRITKNLFKFDDLYTENNYNQFFNPNICHVCKKPNQDELKPCGLCGMVFYCSTEHQIMHQSSHMEVCAVMTFARTEDLELNARPFNSDDEWMSFRKIFMQEIRMKITRDLKPYEKEIIMCPKSCLICHQQISLRTCGTCYSANYCDEHQLDFKKKHVSMCTSLLVFLNLNLLSINKYIRNSYPHNIKFTQIKIDFDDMPTFVIQYINDKVGNVKTWSEKSYIYSDYMSAPLTLFYGLKEFANSFEEAQIYRPEYNVTEYIRTRSYIFIVHIIGASSADVTGLPSWEIFLHIYNQLEFSRNKIRELRIILVIPETDCDRNEYYDVCTNCCHIKRKLYLGNARVSYEDYVRTNLYKQANIIIAFQAEFSVGNALLNIFIATQDRTCPFFFTTASQSTAEENIRKIEEVMNVPREHRSVGNKFRSYKPYRNYDTGEIYYRNAYLVVIL
ncbi:uncharacterized protein LOC116842926 [Odontomachus brunneus]|uniref:uncharacterized protein LOC116842926 n=1 Tax=Odontomachus brunneus TaxID=486640 RepID=UPI0013F1EDFF|nr:uncharacterized protein LOC116842926 [Odontomachus brunneus]